jgi:uncharacterized membrane protein
MTGKFSALRRPGRPLHPPFTHFPIVGYVFAAAFDLASAVGSGHGWAAGLWHSGTFVVVGGLVLCLVTMGTGFWDLVRFQPRSPAALRTTAVHVALMGLVFMMSAGDLAWRLRDYARPGAPAASSCCRWLSRRWPAAGAGSAAIWSSDSGRSGRPDWPRPGRSRSGVRRRLRSEPGRFSGLTRRQIFSPDRRA